MVFAENISAKDLFFFFYQTLPLTQSFQNLIRKTSLGMRSSHSTFKPKAAAEERFEMIFLIAFRFISLPGNSLSDHAYIDSPYC